MSPIYFAYRTDATGATSTISFYYLAEKEETLAQWLRRMRKKIEGQPAKGCTYYGWTGLHNPEIYPLETLTAKNYRAVTTLIPLGVPRYVRVYDKGADTPNSKGRWTVVYSGKQGRGQFLVSADDPSVYSQHGEMRDALGPYRGGRLDTNKAGFSPAVGRRHPGLGLHVPFKNLPDVLKALVRRDYRAAWNLPPTVEEAERAKSQEVEGRREPLPEPPQMIQVVEHHEDGGSPHYVIVTQGVARKLEESGLVDVCCRCQPNQFHMETLTALSWAEFLKQVAAARDGEPTLVVVDLDAPEHHVRAGGTFSYCGNEGQVALPNISATEYEEGLCNVPVCPDCVEGYEVTQSKIRPATAEDEAEANRLAREQGLVPVQAAAEQAQEREQLHREIENEFTAVHWRKALPVSYHFYWHDMGYCLALWDTGANHPDGKAMVGYVLIGPNRNDDLSLDIIFENREGKATQKEPTGPLMAKLALQHILEHQRDHDNSDGLAFSEREARFFESEAGMIDPNFPLDQERAEAPAGRDQYGEPLPTDLILVPTKVVLNRPEHEQLMAAPWYEYRGHMFVSMALVEGIGDVAIDEADPSNMRADMIPFERNVRKVTDNLKRYTPEDGYYHA